jgi:DNA invertase Pin-like site-specific DNA recombinase
VEAKEVSTMPRAYSYIRFSKKEQGNGDSLRRQLAGSQAYCEKRGLQLDDSLSLRDLGVSAFNGKNAEFGALAKFLEAVQTGRVPHGSILIIESLDRLSRNNVDEAYQLFRRLLKAGIDITTLQPFEEYTEANTKDISGLLRPLLIMQRAYEESATKSARCGAAWEEKRANLSEQPATSICPAWLRLKEDRSGYEIIPEKKAIVLRIYEWAREGFGAVQIVAKLHNEGIGSIGSDRKYWNHSYVTRLLRNRAVVGEYQPKIRVNGKPKPEGPPIPGYFPAIMTEAKFRATRRGVEQRRKQVGRRGKHVRNLFTGILFDARDGQSMVIARRPGRRTHTYIRSSGAQQRHTSGQYVCFPYELLEFFVLTFLNKDLAEMMVQTKGAGPAAQIAALTSKLTDLDNRIEKGTKRAFDDPKFEAIFDLLEQWEKEKRATSEALDALKQEQTCNHAETLGEARRITELLLDADPDELLELRTRLKARIQSLVKAIWVLIDGPRQDRVARVQLFLHSGMYLAFTLPRTLGPGYFGIPAAVAKESKLLPEYDLRQWRYLKVKPTFPGPKLILSRGAQEQIDDCIREVHAKVEEEDGMKQG